MRTKCIGGGWDINISKLILRHLLPRTLEAHVDVHLAKFDRQGLSHEDIKDGEVMKLMNNQPDEFRRIINGLDSMRLQGYCIALGTHCDAICMSQVNNYEESSVIDSGAARHIHPDVVVKDSDNLHRLASFTGETSWAHGNGYIPITLRTDQDTEFDLDIQDADFKKDVNAPLLSMCKLLRDGRKFELEWDHLHSYTPNGHLLELRVGTDNVLRLPHMLREGAKSKELPESHPCYSVRTNTTEEEALSFSITSSIMHMQTMCIARLGPPPDTSSHTSHYHLADVKPVPLRILVKEVFGTLHSMSLLQCVLTHQSPSAEISARNELPAADYSSTQKEDKTMTLPRHVKLRGR